MFFKVCGVAMLALLVVGPYISDGLVAAAPTAATTRQDCERELMDVVMKISNDADNQNRSGYREHCVQYKQVIGKCTGTLNSAEISVLTDSYEKVCESDTVKSWLASSGTALRSGGITVTLAFLLATFRHM